MCSLESDKTETIASVVAEFCAEKAKEGFNVYPWVPGERRSNDRMHAGAGQDVSSSRHNLPLDSVYQPSPI
jgi:hypothetical protein